jgi:hypothetical protein
VPFTLFHWGPALLIFSLFISLDPLALLISSVAVDAEGILVLFFNRNIFLQDCAAYSCPLHGPLHSIIGATVSALVIYLLLLLITRPFSKNLKNLLRIKDDQVILTSALVGAYSHIFLDGFLYPEMSLAWPFWSWNPLFGAVGSFEIYGSCVLAFLAGGALLLVRKIKK